MHQWPVSASRLATSALELVLQTLHHTKICPRNLSSQSSCPELEVCNRRPTSNSWKWQYQSQQRVQTLQHGQQMGVCRTLSKILSWSEQEKTNARQKVTNCRRTYIVLSTSKYFYSYKKRLFSLPFSLIDFKSTFVKKQTSRQWLSLKLVYWGVQLRMTKNVQ